jgi:hypothetical protein
VVLIFSTSGLLVSHHPILGESLYARFDNRIDLIRSRFVCLFITLYVSSSDMVL